MLDQACDNDLDSVAVPTSTENRMISQLLPRAKGLHWYQFRTCSNKDWGDISRSKVGVIGQWILPSVIFSKVECVLQVIGWMLKDYDGGETRSSFRKVSIREPDQILDPASWPTS